MLSQKISEHCENRLMNLTELAEKSGLSYNTIMGAKYKKVSIKTLRKIADTLDLSEDERKELVELNKIRPKNDSFKYVSPQNRRGEKY